MPNATKIRRSAQTAAALLLGLGCAGLVSRADATPLATGNSITVGPYTIAVDSCSLSCSGAQFNGVGTGGFIITGAGGGTLLNADSATGPLDISVTFEVTTATPIQNKVLLQVAGGATGGGVAKTDETAQDINFTFTNNGSASAGGSAVNIAYFSGPYDDVLLTKDISADPRGTGTATIQSVTEQFAVPEPASLSVLGVGLIALFARRSRRS